MESPRSLHQEIEAAKALRLQIAALIQYGAQPAELSPDDMQALQDTFDGETNLDRELDRAIADIDEHEALALGLKAKEEQLAGRRERFEKRIETVRGLIEAAMIEANWKTKKLTSATISLRPRPPSVEVDDESLIPSTFFKRTDPRLSKADLNAALKEADKALDAADKLKDAGEKAAAIIEVLKALPPHFERDAAWHAASQVNEPESRLALVQDILKRFPLIPGCHLEKGGVSIQVRR